MATEGPPPTPTSVESAAERGRVAGLRDDAAERRDVAADLRDEAGSRRDLVGDDRDDAGRVRDDAGDRRDGAALRRDQAAVMRDVAAARRDRQADERDRVARQDEAATASRPTSSRLVAAHADDLRSALARREAAGDRGHAARDRAAGATERTQAEHDRGTSLADRGSGASERDEAGSDRERAGADRGWGADARARAARDRDTAHIDRHQAVIDLAHASLDGLTGVYTRSAGLLELQREVERARRSGAPLTLGFLDVDGLKAINDAGGHAAGDRVLVRVAEALHARLRPYDLVVRYGGDEFLCALAGMASGDAASRLHGVNATLSAGEPPVSVSVGVTDLRTDDTVDGWIERADSELYRLRATDTRRPGRAD